MKPKLTKEDIARCVKLKRHGCQHRDIARMLSVTPQTFSTWINHPKTKLQKELSEAIKKAEIDAKESMLLVIMRAAVEDRTWQAAAWFLERKYPAEFGKASRLEAMLAEKGEEELADDSLSKALKELAASL